MGVVSLPLQDSGFRGLLGGGGCGWCGCGEDLELELGGEGGADAARADEVVVAEGDYEVGEPDHGLCLAVARVLALCGLGDLVDVLCYLCYFAPRFTPVVFVIRVKEGDCRLAHLCGGGKMRVLFESFICYLFNTIKIFGI